MFLTHGDQVIDYDLDLLGHFVDALDAQLDRDCKDATSCPDPDSFGVFDRIEHLTGLGFVACQTYLAATYGSLKVPKETALKLGPLHRPWMPVASLVNHAANLWKHQDEWALQQNTRARDRIISAFDDLGYPALGEHPLSGCLSELCSPADARFKSLLPL